MHRSLVLSLALLACAGCAGDEGTGPRSYGDGPRPPAPPTVPSTVPASDAEPCLAGALTAAAGEVQASGPDSRLLVSVTNTGAAACSLTGHGRVALVDRAGAALPTRAVDEGTARTVVLAVGGSAVRDLAWRTVPSSPADPAADCLAGATLRLTPPGAGPLVVEQPVTACDRGTLTGSPWGQTLDRG